MTLCRYIEIFALERGNSQKAGLFGYMAAQNPSFLGGGGFKDGFSYPLLLTLPLLPQSRASAWGLREP